MVDGQRGFSKKSKVSFFLIINLCCFIFHSFTEVSTSTVVDVIPTPNKQPLSIIASNIFANRNQIAKKLEKEYNLKLVTRDLVQKEDIIFDHTTCMVVIDAKEVNQHQILYQRIQNLTGLYNKCWITLQIDPHIDKYALITYLIKI